MTRRLKVTYADGYKEEFDIDLQDDKTNYLKVIGWDNISELRITKGVEET